jgi:hypothetical protein
VSWNELLLDLESYMERYRRALEEITNTDWSEIDDSMSIISDIAQAALDGEPTTADEYNSDEITELVKNYPNDMQLGSEIRTLVNTDLKEYVINNSGASHDTPKQS